MRHSVPHPAGGIDQPLVIGDHPARVVGVEQSGLEPTLRVTNGGRNAIYVVQNHPCDVVGWDGYCYPYAFNLEEFAPITGKLHQPPPAHATFEAPGAAFCAFVIQITSSAGACRKRRGTEAPRPVLRHVPVSA